MEHFRQLQPFIRMQIKGPLSSHVRCGRAARCLGLVLGLGVAALVTGCVSSIVAHKVVAPPNRSGIKGFGSDWEVVKRAPGAYREAWTVTSDDPPAAIAVATIEPGDYDLHYEVAFEYPESGKPILRRFEAFWREGEAIAWSSAPPRGTIVLLHGYLESKEYMVPWAITLAEAGYRCALVDLRGHGASTGEVISFGAFEARDVSLVLDALADRGWDVSRAGILGISYGASVGMIAAGRDPRIATVVAFQPFYSAGRAVPELSRAVFAGAAQGVSDGQFAAALRKAGRIGRFDWSEADVPAALERTQARVLFFHGAADTWLAPDHSEQLYGHAKAGSRLHIVPNDNHVSLRMQVGPFRDAVLEWFGSQLDEPGEARHATEPTS